MIRLNFHSITNTARVTVLCVARPAITDYDQHGLNQQFFWVRKMSLTK